MSSPCRTHSTTCRDTGGSSAGLDGGKSHSNSTTPPAFPRTSGPKPSVVPTGFIKSKTQITSGYFIIMCEKTIHYSVHISVADMTVEWKTVGILTEKEKDDDHSESLQIWSDWTHICQSHNLQHVQSLLAKKAQLSQLHYFLGCAHGGSHLWQIFKLKRLQ